MEEPLEHFQFCWIEHNDLFYWLLDQALQRRAVGFSLALQILPELLVDFRLRLRCHDPFDLHLLLYLIEVYLRILVTFICAFELVHPLEELVALALLVDHQEPLYR